MNSSNNNNHGNSIFSVLYPPASLTKARAVEATWAVARYYPSLWHFSLQRICDCLLFLDAEACFCREPAIYPIRIQPYVYTLHTRHTQRSRVWGLSHTAIALQRLDRGAFSLEALPLALCPRWKSPKGFPCSSGQKYVIAITYIEFRR